MFENKAKNNYEIAKVVLGRGTLKTVGETRYVLVLSIITDYEWLKSARGSFNLS